MGIGLGELIVIIILIIGYVKPEKLPEYAKNIGILLNRKHYYFVPFRQDNPITKPHSIVFDSEYIVKTIESALEYEQIEPILL